MPFKDKEAQRLYMIEYNRNYRKRPEIRKKRNDYMKRWRMRKVNQKNRQEKIKERKCAKWLAPLGDMEDSFPNVDELLMEQEST